MTKVVLMLEDSVVLHLIDEPWYILVISEEILRAVEDSKRNLDLRKIIGGSSSLVVVLHVLSSRTMVISYERLVITCLNELGVVKVVLVAGTGWHHSHHDIVSIMVIDGRVFIRAHLHEEIA